MLYYVMLCYVMLCYVMLCYVMLCYVMLCYVMLCYVMLCHVMLCHIMSCYVMLYHVMVCHVMSCHDMLCHDMLCYVILCHIMSCYVMSCYVMLCDAKQSLIKVVVTTPFMSWFETPTHLAININEAYGHLVRTFSSRLNAYIWLSLRSTTCDNRTKNKRGKKRGREGEGRREKLAIKTIVVKGGRKLEKARANKGEREGVGIRGERKQKLYKSIDEPWLDKDIKDNYATYSPANSHDMMSPWIAWPGNRNCPPFPSR